MTFKKGDLVKVRTTRSGVLHTGIIIDPKIDTLDGHPILKVYLTKVKCMQTFIPPQLVSLNESR